MASIAFHIVAGKEYCKKNNVDNISDFISGCTAPDIAQDRVASHYGKKKTATSYTDAILNKVDLYMYCKKNKINTDYKRGIFFHLITDYLFYKEYLLNSPDYKKIENLPYLDIKNKIYLEYNILNLWFVNNYNLDLEELPEVSNGINDGKLEVLSISELKKLIKELSTIDLDQIYQDVLYKNPRWV